MDKDLVESAMTGFQEEFHITVHDAEVLFREGQPLLDMLQGMYLDVMDAMRECNLDDDGKRLQGQAQVLWSLLSVPQRILEIRNDGQ